MNKSLATVYVGIGANLGEAKSTVLAAIEALKVLPDSHWQQASSLYRTAPVDADGDDYVNAVACLKTSLSPLNFLHALQQIEQQFGRERPYYHAPRTLDLDVLLYDDQQIDLPELKVPHPSMTERAFVLVPLLEIAPQIIIPGLGSAQSFLSHISHQRIEQL